MESKERLVGPTLDHSRLCNWQVCHGLKKLPGYNLLPFSSPHVVALSAKGYCCSLCRARVRTVTDAPILLPGTGRAAKLLRPAMSTGPTVWWISAKRRARSICLHDGCARKPYFNVKGSTAGKFCKTHASEDMMNVVSKRC